MADDLRSDLVSGVDDEPVVEEAGSDDAGAAWHAGGPAAASGWPRRN